MESQTPASIQPGKPDLQPGNAGKTGVLSANVNDEAGNTVVTAEKGATSGALTDGHG